MLNELTLKLEVGGLNFVSKIYKLSQLEDVLTLPYTTVKTGSEASILGSKYPFPGCSAKNLASLCTSLLIHKNDSSIDILQLFQGLNEKNY